MTFDDLRLCEPVLRAVRAEGYTTPTPIQVQAIPPVLEGRDVLGCAQTGTGKTAAFALPIIQRLIQPSETPAAGRGASGPSVLARRPTAFDREDAIAWSRPGRPAGSRTPARQAIRVLVLAPTRELAAQIGESFRAYGRHTNLRSAVIFGGVNQNPQTRALREGIDVLVATPGRLLDLMQQGYVDLGSVQVLVLDEADRMLDMGFIRDIRKIVAKVPTRRQTLFFSATMPADIRQLADEILHQPVAVHVAADSPAADTVTQSVYFVEKADKLATLAEFINSQPITRALVFTRTKHGADRVARHLSQAGIKAEAIHGNKSQNARTRAMTQFKSQSPPVLVATDIAARGLDIDEISHVINYDLPNEPETYVHRIGRTGRAGASGLAVSFCGSDERVYLRDIERLIRKSIPVTGELPRSASVRSSAPARQPQPAARQEHASIGRGRRQHADQSRRNEQPVSLEQRAVAAAPKPRATGTLSSWRSRTTRSRRPARSR